jgi:hypothetical protein
MVFERHGADWDARPLIAGDVPRMPEIEVELPLSDIHADVELQASLEADAPAV